jgi:hypothetical protein
MGDYLETVCCLDSITRRFSHATAVNAPLSTCIITELDFLLSKSYEANKATFTMRLIFDYLDSSSV